MTRTQQPSTTETIALNAMRAVMGDLGITDETRLVDAGAAALIKSGVDPRIADAVAGRVFKTQFKIMGAG